MTDSIVLSSDEQLQLRELQQSANTFLELKALLQAGLFHGQDAQVVIRGQQFAEQMLKQVNDKIQAVRAGAILRTQSEALKKDEKNGQETK